jgi:hypothetical protein
VCVLVAGTAEQPAGIRPTVNYLGFRVVKTRLLSTELRCGVAATAPRMPARPSNRNPSVSLLRRARRRSRTRAPPKARCRYQRPKRADREFQHLCSRKTAAAPSSHTHGGRRGLATPNPSSRCKGRSSPIELAQCNLNSQRCNVLEVEQRKRSAALAPAARIKATRFK